jgi:hypothetical protein
MGLAIADLLAQATDENRCSGAFAAKALSAAMMKTRANKTGQVMTGVKEVCNESALSAFH